MPSCGVALMVAYGFALVVAQEAFAVTGMIPVWTSMSVTSTVLSGAKVMSPSEMALRRTVIGSAVMSRRFR
nr:hypothetical protein [Corynebacterium belfantii]